MLILIAELSKYIWHLSTTETAYLHVCMKVVLCIALLEVIHLRHLTALYLSLKALWFCTLSVMQFFHPSSLCSTYYHSREAFNSL